MPPTPARDLRFDSHQRTPRLALIANCIYAGSTLLLPVAPAWVSTTRAQRMVLLSVLTKFGSAQRPPCLPIGSLTNAPTV